MNDVAISAHVLTRQQAKRLRFYFARGKAFAHQLDGIDLDLAGMGLIETKARSDWVAQTEITLTPAGLTAVHQFRQADISARSVHHSLASRIAAHLRGLGRVTWENTEFKTRVTDRPRILCGTEIDGPHVGLFRPDVFSIKPALQPKNLNPCVHECKVTRADFLSDLAKPEKRALYGDMAETVYYAAPEGIIEPSEVPDGFGLLIERKDGAFVIARKAKRRKVELQPTHYLKMVLKPGAFPDGYRD